MTTKRYSAQAGKVAKYLSEESYLPRAMMNLNKVAMMSATLMKVSYWSQKPSLQFDRH